ncbi:hypothetical protein ABK040_010824 [Willaertia magna]
MPLLTNNKTSDVINQVPSGSTRREKLKKIHLNFYNSIEALHWIYLLLTRTYQPFIDKYFTIPKLSMNGSNRNLFKISLRKPSLWKLNSFYLKTLESSALLESLHSYLGLTNSPISTNIGQTLGRLFIMFFIGDDLPDNDFISDSLLLFLQTSWALADIIRFLYYISQSVCSKEKKGRISSLLKWLRYNGFLVLYPVGMLSEIGLVLRVIVTKWLDVNTKVKRTNSKVELVDSSTKRSKKREVYPLYKKILIIFFFIFIVGYGYPSVFLHMIRQRRKQY